MRVIHVLRKPLSEGTVAANVLKHGCGGLNIDASRITTDDNLNGGAYAENASARHDGAENWRFKRGEQGNAGEYQPPPGRWPANVILQHLDGCRCDGVKKVKGTGPRAGGSGSRFNDPGNLLSRKGHEGVRTNHEGHADKDGTETVANWICEPGCPVKVLDEQSGDRPSGGSPTKHDRRVGIYEDGLKQRMITPYKDTGGASRFFKQVGDSHE